MSNIIAHNKRAWDLNVEMKNRWTEPVKTEVIESAKKGEFHIFLTPKTPIPHAWLENISGLKILGLASGGGQQGPILAAAGADMTVVDLSPKQLEQDSESAKKYGLNINTIESSADNLSAISNDQMDMILNPVSNCFFEHLEPVWKESHRVLKKGGFLIYSFINPVAYCFDFDKKNKGDLQMKYSLPYSDINDLSEEDRKKFIGNETPLEFAHTLSEQIGLMLKSGFVINDFLEDQWDHEDPVDQYFPTFITVRAQKI